jgi:hypothetical protein
VGIDEPGGDDQVPGVDDLLRSVGDFADLGDLAAADGDIRAVARRAGAVNDRAIFDEYVVHLRPPFAGGTLTLALPNPGSYRRAYSIARAAVKSQTITNMKVLRV